ncbi:uncharacterized protein EI90DRAFT_3033999 [Cantharellus anzutake]|uniref:uncharacterized protein n=1 Tax=Cantharellus anzutake TaxID=1750568 RepID=UPI001904902D|nr:uncharacterized protein EI90DRAFT_3033999 [Cantharellus anzutake]KAF8341447.1 hypothetical protein EI90DRAFT_3033999 [Cantharellus anzutake]
MGRPLSPKRIAKLALLTLKAYLMRLFASAKLDEARCGAGPLARILTCVSSPLSIFIHVLRPLTHSPSHCIRYTLPSAC